MAGPYTGIHQFLFIPRDRPELIAAIEVKVGESLRQRDALISKTVFAEGDFAALLHVAKDKAAELGELQAELWDVGVRTDWETEGAVYKDVLGQPMGPRRHSPPSGAICRFGVTKQPLDVLREIGDQLGADADHGPFVGGSQLLRGQLLVQIGAGARDAVRQLVEEELKLFDGVNAEDFQVGYFDLETTQA